MSDEKEIMKRRSVECPKTTEELIEIADELTSELEYIRSKEDDIIQNIIIIQGMIIYRLLCEEE